MRQRAAREGKNPRTGEMVKILGKKLPAFKAAKALKEAEKIVIPHPRQHRASGGVGLLLVSDMLPDFLAHPSFRRIKWLSMAAGRL